MKRRGSGTGVPAAKRRAALRPGDGHRRGAGSGGWLEEKFLMRKVPLPAEGLYPLRTLAGTFAVYGLATVAHGSGFLAVFVAGVLLGDVRAPYKKEIERFHGARQPGGDRRLRRAGTDRAAVYVHQGRGLGGRPAPGGAAGLRGAAGRDGRAAGGCA
ncbi:hypothetical protein LV779_35535 [Streptomyces thinghirensis]|nr:hypothetical protein [Streptomyces thinghirensis]